MTVDHPYRSALRSSGAEWPSFCDHELTIPYRGQERMRLLFATGISDVVLRIDPEQSDLIRAQFDGVVPRVLVTPGEVSVRYRFGLGDWIGGLLSGDDNAAVLSLHPGVAWELILRGGASQVDADMRRGQLESIEIVGGASELDLSLPEPRGVVPVRLRGGACELAIRRPATVPVRVHVSGGCSSLELDDEHIDAVGESVALTSDGWATAHARYDVRVVGGASAVVVTT